ncbi:hypothetical protein DICVIV_10151 [Dictyocaulus viviparus]|uniref:SCP domain-containing protein n=1 Tax=Dictyocaulus viviparus TaxID=29172 RepID=A0A0D8XN93_DICVI|nr:hypothetical protein DICVIV_10151 [Dictyocaulus viviparus]
MSDNEWRSPIKSYQFEAVNEWWNTALQDGTLVDLTPSEENRKMIPFLQIANGGTNKVGCAYHVCNDDYENNEGYENVEEPFLLFVCTYGDSPLYTEGPLCDSCKDRCIYHQTLCDTESA